MSAGFLTVVEAGSTQITDLGRTRGPRYGVPVNGALDQRSARIANILTGNDERAPLLEIMALDVEFVADTDLLIALAGAEASLRVGGIDRPNEQPVSVRAGESRFDGSRAGCAPISPSADPSTSRACSAVAHPTPCSASAAGWSRASESRSTAPRPRSSTSTSVRNCTA
jgi:hypothetical protein